jgi:hypothetical protein
MNSTCVSPVAPSLQHQVRSLLSQLHPRPSNVERRSETRYPYPYLVRLTPVDDDGTTPVGEPLVVVGKHVSESGMGFFHPEPLPFRYVIASFGDDPDSAISLLINLSWCRFARQGWYESGGRFLETAEG